MAPTPRAAAWLAALACLLGSGAATPVCVSVESNLTAPVLLAYSGAEQLLEAGDLVAVNFSGPETVWIVPSGEAWDPQRGCPGSASTSP